MGAAVSEVASGGDVLSVVVVGEWDRCVSVSGCKMKCADPFVATGGRAFSCGKCLPCLRNRRSIWAHRIMLEAQCHQVNAFVTLTYANENFQYLGQTGFPTLDSRHLQLWLKRFRRRVGLEVRYFAVGEYDATWRPHFHVALFGFPSCLDMYGPELVRYGCGCLVCSTVRDTWGFGFISVGNLSEKSAAYVAGYVTAKIKNKAEHELCGRTREFARMSLKPGIGLGYVSRIGSVLPSGLLDVPNALRYGGSVQRPLGRYLQRGLRKEIGRYAEAPREVQIAQQEQMRNLRLDARYDSDNPSLKSRLVEAGKGVIASIEAKDAIRRSKS